MNAISIPTAFIRQLMNDTLRLHKHEGDANKESLCGGSQYGTRSKVANYSLLPSLCLSSDLSRSNPIARPQRLETCDLLVPNSLLPPLQFRALMHVESKDLGTVSFRFQC